MGLLSAPIGASRDELRTGQPDQPVADGLEPEIEVQGAGDGLEGGGQQRRPATAAALGLALAEQERLAEVDPAGQPGETGRRHDGGAPGAQIALVVVGMADIEGLRDGQVDHAVAEELEAFVVADRRVAMLVVPARVDEGLLQQVEVADREPDPRREGLAGTHGDVVRSAPSERLGGALVDVVDGVLDGADLLGVLVGDLRPELLFEAHDELDEVQRVGVQVVDERRLRLDLILVGAELLDDDLLEALVRCCH